MKYSLNTTSKPVVGAQAKKLLKAVKEGTSMTNAAAQATIERLIARRQGYDAEQNKGEVR